MNQLSQSIDDQGHAQAWSSKLRRVALRCAVLCCKARHKAPKTAGKLFRIKQAEDPAERVVARQTVLKREKLAQELFLRLGKFGHIDRCLTAAQHRAQRDQQYLKQIMSRRVARARIIQILKTAANPSIKTPVPNPARIELISAPTATLPHQFKCDFPASFSFKALTNRRGSGSKNDESSEEHSVSVPKIVSAAVVAASLVLSSTAAVAGTNESFAPTVQSQPRAVTKATEAEALQGSRWLVVLLSLAAVIGGGVILIKKDRKPTSP